MYGDNHYSNRKIQVVEELWKGKDFQMIAREMRVAVVYAIDSFAANAPVDESVLARYLHRAYTQRECVLVFPGRLGDECSFPSEEFPETMLSC